MESGGNDGFGGDDIALLTEDLIQLSIKSSMVEPSNNFSLICSVWTNKPYNQDSFKVHMRSIWKTKKKFVIQVAGQNLFLIAFQLEEDLETVLEGQPWLFRKQLILFDRLNKSMLRDQIRLVSSPFWIKIGPCLPEFDKKDLLHAIGVTFGGGVGINLGFHEKLSTYCFGYGKLGHGITKDQEEYQYREQSSGLVRGIQDYTCLASVVADLESHKEVGINEGDTVDSLVNNPVLDRKASWKRMKIVGGKENHEADRSSYEG
ncbi:hypothetical protein GOBAR_DD25408 [Gossypium barbadense]|nr:hypothetical protein GOBAR_DD25408 [Gossypium barbadense]